MADIVLQYAAGIISTVPTDDGLVLTIRAPPEGGARLTAAAFDSTSTRLVVSDAVGALAVLDLAARRYKVGKPLGASPTLLQFSRARPTELHSAMGDGAVQCFDSATGEVVALLTGHEGAPHSLSQSADGRVLLTASRDSAIIWSTDEWTRKRSLGATAGVACATFVHDPAQLVVAFGDDSVLVYSADDYHVLARLRLPEAEVGAGIVQVATSADGTLLVAGASNGCVYCWDVPSETLARVVDLPEPSTTVLQVGAPSLLPLPLPRRPFSLAHPPHPRFGAVAGRRALPRVAGSASAAAPGWSAHPPAPCAPACAPRRRRPRALRRAWARGVHGRPRGGGAVVVDGDRLVVVCVGCLRLAPPRERGQPRDGDADRSGAPSCQEQAREYLPSRPPHRVLRSLPHECSSPCLRTAASLLS